MTDYHSPAYRSERQIAARSFPIHSQTKAKASGSKIERVHIATIAGIPIMIDSSAR